LRLYFLASQAFAAQLPICRSGVGLFLGGANPTKNILNPQCCRYRGAAVR